MKKTVYILILTLLTAAAAKAEEITIIAVGDIMPTARALPFIKKEGFGYPYRASREILKGGDIVIGNLETPLASEGRRFEDKKYTFKAPLETASALKDAGFTHMSLANNHMMDYGSEGLAYTLSTLDGAGLNYAGAGENIIGARKISMSEVKGKKIAFLSYSKTYPTEFYASKNGPGTAPGYRKFIASDLKKAAAEADIVIVAFHWGGEKLEHPRDYQKELARLSIDSGADIVIGHHPHVLQGIEHYKDGVIFYSLGNFAFGSYSPSSRESIMARVVLEDGGISSVEAIPINVNNFEVHFQPQLFKGEKGGEVITRLSALSGPLGSSLIFADGVGIAGKLDMITKKGDLSPLEQIQPVAAKLPVEPSRAVH
ncbi:MAG: CapA family protein [bacterium]|nr:CapA family protein [bacterium]